LAVEINGNKQKMGGSSPLNFFKPSILWGISDPKKA